jgi:hypothetical protein
MERLLAAKSKRILGYLIILSLMFGYLAVPQMEARAEDLLMSFSSTSVKIGDSVTVTITVPAGVTATVNLTYSTGVFQYSSASTTTNVNAGTVVMTLGGYGANNQQTSETVTFKAKAAGSGRFVASAPSAGDQEGDRVVIGGASATVKVENESEDGDDSSKSADNSLTSLKISEGTLSPSFSYNVTNYTAVVSNDVTSLEVSAKPNNPNATIDSVKGADKLSVGTNKIRVVVKAENGVTATYTITVTRKGAEDSDEEGVASGFFYEIDGVKLYPSAEIPKEVIPDGFVKDTLVLGEDEYPCLYNEEIGAVVCLLYLVDENGDNGALYIVADSALDYVYPFVCVDYEQYMNMQQVDEEEETEEQTEDIVTEPSADAKKIASLQSQNRLILCAFAIVVMILIIVIVLLLLVRRRENQIDLDEKKQREHGAEHTWVDDWDDLERKKKTEPQESSSYGIAPPVTAIPLSQRKPPEKDKEEDIEFLDLK